MDKTNHKKVYGAGYYAGVKDASNNSKKICGSNRGYRNATNAMLCWKPHSSEVKVIPWPDRDGKSDKYPMSGLAAYSHIRQMDFEQRKTIIFIEAMHLIVRDWCDPASVHLALLELEEYRDGCSSDMPWMNNWI